MTKKLQIQYVPWRTKRELHQVRYWLFSAESDQSSALAELDVNDEPAEDLHIPGWKEKRKACDTISAWKTRPPLPHAIESTWLITEARLADTATHRNATISTFSIKAGYITALTRFVTALLDSSQTSKFKVSMYAKAAEIGLPAMFVDLRHEATHGEMPSLSVLRAAAIRALSWLKEYYWDGIGDGELHRDGVDIRHDVHGSESVDSMDDDGDDVEPWQYSTAEYS